MKFLFPCFRMHSREDILIGDSEKFAPCRSLHLKSKYKSEIICLLESISLISTIKFDHDSREKKTKHWRFLPVNSKIVQAVWIIRKWLILNQSTLTHLQ